MNTKPEIAISDTEWNIIRGILRRYIPQYSVWAFGSRARRTHKPFSDLDIAVIGERAIPLSTLAELNEAFSESDLPWKVDIVDWSSVSETFQRLIEGQKVPLQ